MLMKNIHDFPKKWIFSSGKYGISRMLIGRSAVVEWESCPKCHVVLTVEQMGTATHESPGETTQLSARWPSCEFIRGMGYALFLVGDRLARVASWMLFHCGSIKRFSIFNGPSLIKTFFCVRQPYHPPPARVRALTCALHINEGRSCLSVFWMLSHSRAAADVVQMSLVSFANLI